MRRSTAALQSARSAALQAQRRVPSGPSPFVCANCRQAIIRVARPSFASSTRSFTRGTSRRQQGEAPTSSTSTAPQKETIAPQTHYDFFPETFPNGPPPNSPFCPDLKQLRKEFLQSQAKTHPDLAPADRKRQAEALSMRINEAYKTLQDPLKRAQYLLLQQGVDVEDESLKMGENELLMEVMEAREAIDEAESEGDLVGLRTENDERIAGSVKILEQAFAKGEFDAAAQEAVRLRYWMNIEESIQGWEKGKGGGLVHH